MAGPFTSGHKVLNTDINPMLLGWVDFSWFGSTLAYVSADAPTFVFSVNADVTAVVEPGMRIRLTQTTDKFFIVTAVGAFSGGVTPITVYGGTDYALANASILAGSFSTHKKPFGFNASPLKWTETLHDTTLRTVASPTQNVWYNPGSLSISLPIGVWNVTLETTTQANRTGSAAGVFSTLSTGNNSETDTDFTSYSYVQAAGNGTNQISILSTQRRQGVIAAAAKTSLYINVSTDFSDLSNMYLANSNAPLVVLATCAYL
jgi:hypothetical protein